MQFCIESVFQDCRYIVIFIIIYTRICNGPRASILTPNEEEQAYSTMFVGEIR